MADKRNAVAEIIRMATLKKPVRLSIGKVEILPELNVREPDTKTWDIPAMADDLALNGQKEPALVVKIGKGDDIRYRPIRGFRRASGVVYNAERGIIDPATDKAFDSLLAFVIEEELTEQERLALLLDQGNTKSLTKVELFYAAEKVVKVFDTVPQMTVALRGLLDEIFPCKNPEILDKLGTPEGDKAYNDYRRGVMQNLVAATNAPAPLREAYVAKCKNVQKWPSEREVKMLADKFVDIQKKDTTNTITKAAPGKEWSALWQEFKDKKLSSIATTGKPASQAMMNGDEVTAAKNRVESRILKTVFDCVKRAKGADALAILDVLLVDVEAGKATPEQITSILDSLNPSESSEKENIEQPPV